jgi:hypothetical protein
MRTIALIQSELIDIFVEAKIRQTGILITDNLCHVDDFRETIEYETSQWRNYKFWTQRQVNLFLIFFHQSGPLGPPRVLGPEA